MNVPKFPEGKRPKATDVSPWYGVYFKTFYFFPLRSMRVLFDIELEYREYEANLVLRTVNLMTKM